MRNPTDEEKVKCPESSNQKKNWIPDKVWETKGPTGERQKFGTLKPHIHRKDAFSGRECDQSGLPVPVIHVPSNNKPDPEAAHRSNTNVKYDNFSLLRSTQRLLRAAEICEDDLTGTDIYYLYKKYEDDINKWAIFIGCTD